MELNYLMYGKDYPIVDVKDTNDKYIIYVESECISCKCPKCGCDCNKTHDVHLRKIQDTPIHNKETWVYLTVNDFKCTNKECNQKTFTEDVPFVGKNQVMTYYLQYYILTLAINMSSNATSLTSSLLGIKISPDTVDNILKNTEIKDDKDVEEIGIDDVALRKGMSYATAIYNLKNHQLIALLKGREKDDIVPWLKEHPKIKLVARDRASAYADAVKEVFPDAIQVADRFHLFQNLTGYLKDILYKELPEKIVIKNNEILNKKAEKVVKELTNIDDEILNSLNYDNTPPIDEFGNVIEFISSQVDLTSDISKQHEENRKKKYDMIINLKNRLKDTDCPKVEILAKEFNLSIATIKKYIKMSDEEVEKVKEKKTYNTKDNELKSYCNIIYKMLIDNIPYEYIFAYCKKLGCKCTDIQLRGFIYRIANNNKIGDIKLSVYSRYEYSEDETVITRHELFKFILTLDTKKAKNKTIEENINIIKDRFSVVQKIEDIFLDFHDTIFSNNTNKLDEFILKYKDYISSFCNGLKKDITAIKNAISNEINSGFVEGNNNKFKLIKRIVYGKQKLVNLFKRCWLNFSSTLDDLAILKEVIDPFVKYQDSKKA